MLVFKYWVNPSCDLFDRFEVMSPSRTNRQNCMRKILYNHDSRCVIQRSCMSNFIKLV